MNENPPRPNHPSYQRHRKQLTWQIIMPMVLSTLLLCALVALIVNATFFQGTGDVARWAAISTIWIVLPIIVGLLIVLALLFGLVYLMAKLLNVTPTYTSLAQHYVDVGLSYVKRAAEALVKPVIELNGILASITAFFEKIKP